MKLFLLNKLFSLLQTKQLTEDPSLPQTQDHQDRKKLKPATVRRKSKSTKRKNKNPVNGRVASTTNNYSIQNNETQIDFFVDRLRNELKIHEDKKIKVTGLSGKPKRTNAYWKATTKVRKSAKYGVMPLAEKLYKVGIDFSREDLSISEDMFRYDSETSYTKAVLDPLNSYLQGHFGENNFIRAKVHKISGGMRSNGQISVWFHIWLRVSAVEVFHHLRRFRTNFMKLHPVESISLLNEMLIDKKYFISSCFDDYEVQQRVFKQLEKSLFEHLQVDPIKWKNQELLYTLVKKRFKTAKAEHSPSWLGQQRFDIYIPSKKIAIEYQGQQHYEPVEFFGGENAFQKTVARDKRKFALSKKHKVHVLYWDYRTEISEESVDLFFLENDVR